MGTSLNPTFPLFGQVKKGLDVLAKINEGAGETTSAPNVRYSVIGIDITPASPERTKPSTCAIGGRYWPNPTNVNPQPQLYPVVEGASAAVVMRFDASVRGWVFDLVHAHH